MAGVDDALGREEPAGPQAPAEQRRAQHQETAGEGSAALLAERYGTAPDPNRRRRLTWIIGGTLGVLVLLVGAWFIVDGLRPTATAQEVGFVVHDETSIEIIFDLTMRPGDRAECTVEALDARWGQVGLLDAQIGPMPDWVNRVHLDVATSAPAASGVVRSCALID